MRHLLQRAAAFPLLVAGGAFLVGITFFSFDERVRGQAAKASAAPASAAKDKAKAASVEVMTFPSDRDAKNMIQAVIDYMKEFKEKPEKAPWDRICQAAQQVLDAKSDSFFELPKTSPDAPQGRVSAKAE